MTGGEKQVYKDQPRPHLEDRGPMQRPPIFETYIITIIT